MRRAPLPLLLIVAAGCSGGDEDPRPRPERWVTHHDTAHAYRISHPASWRPAPRPLTPGLGDPHEILALSTSRVRPNGDGDCGHAPVDAVRELPAAGVLVTIQERRGVGGFQPRPRPFVLGPPGQGDAAICAKRPDVSERGSDFRDAGRGLHVRTAFGPRAPASSRQVVERVLDSLVLEPPWRYTGMDVRMQPPSGWRVKARGNRFNFGAWDVPEPPDGACEMPRGARELPPDGAFAFVYEYVGLNRTQRMRFPATPRFRLPARERRGYECFGESWLFRWRDKGRTLQAHAYLGPRATPARRRELLAALRSIVVLRRR